MTNQETWFKAVDRWDGGHGAPPDMSDPTVQDGIVALLREEFHLETVERIKAKLSAAIRDVVIPEITADIKSRIFGEMLKRLDDLEAEINAAKTAPEPGLIDEVLKEQRARQEDWR